MKLFLFLAVLPFIGAAPTENCDVLLQKADLCFQKLLTAGNPYLQHPQDDKEMVGVCREMRVNLKCINRHTKTCMKLFPKQVVNLIYKGAKKWQKDTCATATSRNGFMRQVNECQKKEVQDMLDPIIFRMVLFFDYAAKNVTADPKLTWMCCGESFIRNELSQKVTTECGPFFEKFTRNIFATIFDETLDFACGRFSSPEMCLQNAPETSAYLKKVFQINEFQLESTVWSPIVKLLTSLDN